jgi:hypothetical protein
MLVVEEAAVLLEVYLHVVDHQEVEGVMALVLKVELTEKAAEVAPIMEVVVMA